MNKPLGSSFQVNLWQDDKQLFRKKEGWYIIQKQEDI